jgi:very-short-patch-repair endonuclease
MSGIEKGGARKVLSTMRTEACAIQVSDRQNHVITRAQLKECGFSIGAIARRVARGWLHRKHQGVYAVGRPDLSQAGVFHAAVLAVGQDARLSHRSAAVQFGFWPYGELDVVEVTVPRRGIRRPGIRIYTVDDIPRACRTVWHAVPVTTAAHAILDLAATLTSDEVFARTLHEAEVQDWVTDEQLRAELDRHPNHPGRGRLERELGWGPTPTRSPPEDRLVDILRRHGFPRFETNARIPGLPRWIEVDVLFPVHNVVIEVDGDRFHKTRYRRRRDARKQAIIEGAGLRVVRLTPDDVEPSNEAQTVARLRHAIPETPPATPNQTAPSGRSARARRSRPRAGR